MSLDFLRRPIQPAIARAAELGRGSLDTREEILAIISACEAALAEPAAQDDAWLSAEINNNLGVAFTMLARHEADSIARRPILAMALRHLGTALGVRTRAAAPLEWAVTKANLALAHLQRYRAMGDQIDLMAARVDVDLAHAMFEELQKDELRRWTQSVREALIAAGREN